MDKPNRLKNKELGQSMVELALSFTFLMILLAGTIDLGRALFTWLALRDAAQEGASYGSIRPADSSGVQTRVWDNLTQVVSNPSTKISVNVSIVSQACLGNTIQVDVNYNNFPLSMPFLGALIGDTIPIHATINDTILRPKCP